VAALLDHLKIAKADLIGYSMGGGVAMQCAIRHPDKVRKVVSISARFRSDGVVKEGVDAIIEDSRRKLFIGSPLETEYKKLSPTPDDFPKFVKRGWSPRLPKGHDLSANQLKATTAPMFFIFGDADGIRLDHVEEMFRPEGRRVARRPGAALRLAVGHSCPTPPTSR
jgi:pimeloyl-ACP methyl ester carboxylesterase